MNRRDFIKTALVGLAALVLPKAQEPAPLPDTLLGVPIIWREVPSMISSKEIVLGGWIEPAESSWSLCNADGECIGARGRLKMHSTVSPLFATDEMIADWEAIGWKSKEHK